MILEPCDKKLETTKYWEKGSDNPLSQKIDVFINKERIFFLHHIAPHFCWPDGLSGYYAVFQIKILRL